MIVKLDKIDSTNRYGLQKFDEFEDNTLIVANSQNGGQGRRGKYWYSPPDKNIYATYIIKKPMFPIEKSLWICGLAALKTLRDCTNNLNLWLKWPNDVYCTRENGSDQHLKIAGLLAEMHSPFGSNKLDGVVAGLGINLNMTEDDLLEIDQPATSPFIETGITINIDDFTQNLFNNLFEYRKIAEDSISLLYNKWKLENGLIGKNVTLKEDDKSIAGIVKNVSEAGAIIICTSDGVLHEIISGDLVRIKS